jgi:hypothetical protein
MEYNMMYYNFYKIFDLRGITNPFVFLIDNGFSRGQAFNITNRSNNGLRIENLEKLCLVLSCTPNDLIEWVPPKVSNVPDTHPLHKLKPTETLDFSELTKDIPIEKFPEIYNAIKEAKEKIKAE